MPTVRAMLLTGLLSLTSIDSVHTADVPLVRPEAGPWDAGVGFSFDTKNPEKSRRSLSGIACPLEGTMPRRCLVVFDEGVEARTALIGDRTLAPEADRLVLLPGGKELDAEAAAREGAYIYVAGSHSAKRASCENNPDSRHVIRLGIDATTGQVKVRPDGLIADLSDSGRLWSLMTSHPALQDHAGDRKCLGTDVPERAPGLRGRRGVNIEGLAAKEGRLYFGFRGPAENGTAKMLSVDADALFSGRDLAASLVTILVGKGRGIRDLLAVRGGFLVLVGPDDDRESSDAGWSIAFWDGTSAGDVIAEPRVLAHLDLSGAVRTRCDDEIKPEAIMQLEDGSEFCRVLILSDGMCDGGALAFRIPK